MIGIVLVTHGQLATAFTAALEHIVGAQDQLRAICIEAEDDMEERRRAIRDAIAAVDDGGGVAVLTDMFGGTPSNLAISLMAQGRVEVVAGLNLPLLIKLASVRGQDDLTTALARAQEAGRKYIHIASTVLHGEGTSRA